VILLELDFRLVAFASAADITYRLYYSLECNERILQETIVG